jgi:plasmid stability protein
VATLTLKNVPDDLHERLKLRAKQNRRSLNQEAIATLEGATGREGKLSAAEQAKALRERLAARGDSATIEEIDHYINEGRRYVE